MHENWFLLERLALSEHQLRLREAEERRRKGVPLREVRAHAILRKSVLKALRAGLRPEQVGEEVAHALRAAEGR
jgi:urease gamma subunit